MGKRGPKPTPTATLKIRGSTLVHKRGNEPDYPRDIPEPTNISDEALVHWRELAPQLTQAGVMMITDWRALARYCRLCVRFDQAQDSDEETKVNAALCKLEAMFGLSPADRSSIKADKPINGPQKKDYFAS